MDWSSHTRTTTLPSGCPSTPTSKKASAGAMPPTSVSSASAQARRGTVQAMPVTSRRSLRLASDASWTRSSARTARSDLPTRPTVRPRATDEGRSIPGETEEDLPESVWALKPWWCQPYSILTTGATLVGGSAYVSRDWETTWLRVLSVGLVAAAVLLWWSAFLVAYPRAYATYRSQWKRQQVRDSDAFPQDRS
eukprot:scaffold1771_cov343-Pavlova_lutheri.AAC.7